MVGEGMEKIFCTIINVYAPCDLVGKKNLWRKLLDVKSQRLWYVGGDFNAVKFVSERKGVEGLW